MITNLYIVVFSVIGILISYPGFTLALNFLIPVKTNHAYRRLSQTPFVAMFTGSIVTFIILFGIIVAFQFDSGIVKAVGVILGVAGLGIGSIGSAAISRILGERLAFLANSNFSPRYMAIGAIVYELACLTPIVGWFLFIPISTIAAVGAAVFGILGWSPKSLAEETPEEEAVLWTEE